MNFIAETASEFEPMQILPVLDLMQGQVVRGVAGRRETYRPVQSVLTSSSEPLDVARAIQAALGLSPFYVVDLDAIQHQTPQLSVLCELADAFPGSWLDGGVRTAADIPLSLAAKDITFVLGLETIQGPSVLRELCETFGPERIVFSLDLQQGLPMGDLSRWQGSKPWDIVLASLETGVTQILVLDLAQVGMGEGVSTQPFCRRVKREFPFVQVATGGGIRNTDDLRALKEAGVDSVLIASALHDGSLGRSELSR